MEKIILSKFLNTWFWISFWSVIGFNGTFAAITISIVSVFMLGIYFINSYYYIKQQIIEKDEVNYERIT